MFDLAMLDFALTAAWAGLVLFERGGRRRWRLWASLALFCVVPSLGIAAFLLMGAGRPSRDRGPSGP